MQERYLGIEDVFDAEQDGKVVAAILELVDDLKNAYLRAALAAEGPDDDFALGRNVEITGAPAADAVQVDGIFHRPLLHRFLSGQLS